LSRDDFPADYFAAREQFVTRATALGWTLSSHTIAARGPDGEALTIDTAMYEPPDTRGTVIVTSGLHGIEGFLGSAVQSSCLLKPRGCNPSASASNVRLVFVHALNPYGFAWLRRANEDNVDLNRNFLAAGKEYRGFPDGYNLLDPFLNPPGPPRKWEPFRLRAALAIMRWGMPALKAAIASGQYDYPRGLFFGGHGPCETHRLVRDHFAMWLGPDGRAIHLDFHTGLGDWARVQLLSDVILDDAEDQRLERELGHRPISGGRSPVVQYAARGSIGEWCARTAQDRDYRYLCAEFGTYPPVKVLTALRAENRAQHWGQRGTPNYRWAKDLIREAFCPQSPRWRECALSTGVDLVQRAIAAIGA
jgi:hypothetical protein